MRLKWEPESAFAVTVHHPLTASCVLRCGGAHSRWLVTAAAAAGNAADSVADSAAVHTETPGAVAVVAAAGV